MAPAPTPATGGAFMSDQFPRESGILLHPTSLPGPHGIGDIGDAAFRFVDWLDRAGQRLWQVMPLGPTGFGDSPYASPSAFAGNPLLVSLAWLGGDGLLDPSDWEDMLALMKAYNGLTTDLPASAFYTNEFLPK